MRYTYEKKRQAILEFCGGWSWFKQTVEIPDQVTDNPTSFIDKSFPATVIKTNGEYCPTEKRRVRLETDDVITRDSEATILRVRPA